MSAGQQDGYIQSLKRIKELEEKADAEVAAHRHTVENEMKKLDEDLARSIEAANAAGEQMVLVAVEAAKKKAEEKAGEIIRDANEKAKSISSHLDTKSSTDKIIEILLSGL
ncbi:MAG: hypothetical protein ABI361_13585 [Nitrososphaera sp.]|jgi:vacuolar-type H+-ATPase subunit H